MKCKRKHLEMIATSKSTFQYCLGEVFLSSLDMFYTFCDVYCNFQKQVALETNIFVHLPLKKYYIMLRPQA